MASTTAIPDIGIPITDKQLQSGTFDLERFLNITQTYQKEFRLYYAAKKGDLSKVDEELKAGKVATFIPISSHVSFVDLSRTLFYV